MSMDWAGSPTHNNRLIRPFNESARAVIGTRDLDKTIGQCFRCGAKLT